MLHPSEFRKIEIKVKSTGDLSEWEDIYISMVWMSPSLSQAKSWLHRIVDNNPNIDEIRFNIAGSLQGHYIRSNNND